MDIATGIHHLEEDNPHRIGSEIKFRPKNILCHLCIEANVEIRPDALEAFHRALGPETGFRLTVQPFPAIVVNDLHEGGIYTEGRNKYQRPWPKI